MKNAVEVRTISDSRVQKRKYQTIPLAIKREIKALAHQGFGLKEVKQKLDIPYLPKQTFHNIKKKSYDNQVNSRSYNATYKATDHQIVRDFENDAVRLYKQKNKSGSFPSKFLARACFETQKLEKYNNVPSLQKLKFTKTYCMRLRKNHFLQLTSRKSDAKQFTEAELEAFRNEMAMKLAGVPAEFTCNTDESGIFINLTTAKSLRGEGEKYKIEQCKQRITFISTLFYKINRMFPPCVICRTKGSRWKWITQQRQVVKVQLDGETIEVERFHCKIKSGGSFTLYQTSKAWMTSAIWLSECERLATFLSKKFPTRKFKLAVDNCPSHRDVQYPNLSVVKLPAGTTSYTQACDVLYFAVLKNKYKSKLADVLWDKVDGKRYVNEGEAVQILMQQYKEIDQLVVDASFEKTKIPIYANKKTSLEFSNEELEEMIDEEMSDRQLALEIAEMVTSCCFSVKNLSLELERYTRGE